MSQLKSSTVTERVRAQYEAYPYPDKDLEQEPKFVKETVLDDLEVVNHYGFQGKKNFFDNFRVLIAGGGTGSETLFLADQLKQTNATIVYLDLSKTSMEIAKQRALQHGLINNITWFQGSLLDLPTQNIEPFDYICCCGVLHHLEHPMKGLLALKSVLKIDGVMGVMLYGTYGRTGVKQIQKLMRFVNHEQADFDEKVVNGKKLFQSLPDCNWYRRGEELFSPSDKMNDSEFHDMFLNVQEQTYSISEIFQLLEKAELSFLQFGQTYRPFYDLDFTFEDSAVRTKLEQLSRAEQLEAAELYWGVITKHSFWISSQANPQALFGEGKNVPFFSRLGCQMNLRQSILETRSDSWNAKFSHKCGIQRMIGFSLTPMIRLFIELIDGRRTVEEIINIMITKFGPNDSAEKIIYTCSQVFQTLLKYDLLLLRHVSTPSLSTEA